MWSNRTPSGAGRFAGLAIAISAITSAGPTHRADAADVSADAVAGPLSRGNQTLPWTLQACIDSALEKSHRRTASQFDVDRAEAKHRQVLSAYWPQLQVKGSYLQMDESPNFLFPASSFEMPPLTVPIPEQDIKMMDPQSYLASLDLVWLLWDGSMRKGYREQTTGLVDMMKEEARRTDLEIVDTVTRYYYGSVLARQLREVGEETLARMEATLSITETMYKEGSGRVKKTDFLSNKVMVETIRSIYATLEKNEEMAQAALANACGMEWSNSVQPAETEVPYEPYPGTLDELVDTAYRFSPDWAKLEAGLQACEGALKTAKSGYYPKVALIGDVHKWWNDYDAGMATDRNKDGWDIGVGLEFPLFDGFLTRNKVAEARAQLGKVEEQGFLLREGIGLQIRDIVVGLEATQKKYQATLDAMEAAVENRDLNTRAYQNELVETQDVIQAQLVEALMKAQHYKARYDHVTLRSRLDLVVGTEVRRQLGNPEAPGGR